jgi:sterol desaturase/sphingolipid hydroxylase (fatty acid hydroxylase superfamily)
VKTSRARERRLTRVATALLVLQASAIAVSGLALLVEAGRDPGQGYGVAAFVVMLAAAGTGAVAVGVSTRRRWGRPSAIAAETVFALFNVAGVAHRPVGSCIGFAIEAAVVVLVTRAGRPPVAAASADPADARSTPPWRAGHLVVGVATLVVFLGALAVRSQIVFGLVVLAAVFVPLEKIFALHPQRAFRRGWKTDVVHFVVNNLLTTAGLLIAVVAVGGVLHALVPDATRAAIASQPWIVQFSEAMLAAALFGYLGHRAAHSVPYLWRFHKVHHSIEEMDWLAAARLHPIDQAFIRSCIVIPLFVLGFSQATFGAYLVFAAVQALFIHANVRLRFGPLRWFIATPEFHHWHHSNDPAAYNSNFAGEFPWLDGLFGTLHLPRRQMPTRYGIDDQVPSGYLRQLAWPFEKRTVPTVADLPA